MFDAGLIGDIYEAAAVPERWAGVLQTLADQAGARGSNLIRFGPQGLAMTSTESVQALTVEFDRLGYNAQNTRVSRLLARGDHPGFLTDSDVHSADELVSLPIYSEFLVPHGMDAGAATVIQGAGEDGLILALEGFAGHEASRQAARRLDALRPHLARALALSAQLRMQRVEAAVNALDLVSVAAGVIDPAGRIEAMNPRFAAAMDSLLAQRAGVLHAVHPGCDAQLRVALARLRERRAGCSLPLRDAQGAARHALHLVPMHGLARDAFDSAGAVLILAGAGNPSVPGADLIRALFDLTPAEARVARAVAQGLSPTEIASRHTASPATVRTQLKHVFAKTGVTRQTELAVLLASLAGPLDPAA
ncbi:MULTISPECIES: helix-turn-helix transcriptional regulator [unclassified Novosphingobium]|uniref:helix-turn-helix transcriptional regulator n=1 Tax=unclassified Novosphingobium TaxID=2644732 RepID=UPI00146F0111|nr:MULTISPECIES: helix-turn-helix transcriptional regulator [unclassified Novosphingobium]NMN05850.1 DNA-binding CsgD family transcriptional regulator [Novosphingobium sp. SG919]NMN87790.1 DNA-binding CsgD family transcriptional regulator [Novosphingobium sp. SG916]